MAYPDYVKKYRPKGTIIKYANDTYYVYYATSKRVPGKTYPVLEIGKLAGKIDESGFHPVTTVQLNLDRVVIRECGFTNYLLSFEDIYICDRKESIKEKRNLYRSLIAYFSNNSYLHEDEDTTIYTPDQMASLFHVSVETQKKKIEKLCGHKLEELNELKGISNARIGGHVYNSVLTATQERVLKELGITENDIR